MRCFAVLGPSFSGKSALVDQLAALEGAGQASDSRAGVRLVKFGFMEEDWCAVDCPGAIEAIHDTKNALLAADMAVICVSPDPEEAVLAAPYIRAAEEAGTPSLIFINRIDESRGRVRDVVAALQDYASHVLVLRQIPIREGEDIVGAVDLVSERAWQYREGKTSALIEIPDSASERESEARAEMLENLSEFDDWLLEEIIEDREPEGSPVYSICTRVLQDNKIMPALIGSALHMNGIMRLMKALRHEAPGIEGLTERLALGTEVGNPAAVGFLSTVKQHVGKTVFFRALADGIGQGETLAGGNIGGLNAVGAEKGAIAGTVPKGTVVGAVKSDQLGAGKIFTADAAHEPPAWARAPEPMVARILVASNERDEVKLSSTLARLAEDDPGLEASQEAGTGSPLVRVQGQLHLRKLKETLLDIFGITVEDHEPTAVYRETITRKADIHYRHRKQTGGAGQFADVRLVVQPNPRGTGFTFDETVKGGAVPRNYIPSVEAGAEESLAKGPLGFPVIDVGVTLYDGQHHSVDSSDFAFKTAGRMGVQQGLGEAGAVLLQPIFQVSIFVPSVYSGSLVGIVSSLKGQVLGFDRDPDAKGWDIFRALLPGSALDGLVHDLRSATQGLAYYTTEFDHFEELYGKEAEKIVEEKQRG